MMKTRRIAIVIILATAIAMATPASAAMFYGQGQCSVSAKAEKIVEFADRAGQQVDYLIDLVYVNTTAIEDAGLLDELEGNVTLFDEGLANVTEAYVALEAEDYEGAIANATQALRIFREVFRSIHIILRDSGVQKGQIIDAQGLLEAMRRALERIEQLRELLPEDATEALDLLDEATNYLDIDEAKLWLLEGKVSETAHNLTQANQLITQAHQYLKYQAKKWNSWRINNYLCDMTRVQERIKGSLEFADNEGIDISAVLESLGYENVTEFMEALQNMTETAEEKMDEIRKAIQDLEEISRTMREMEQTLNQEIGRYRTQPGFGYGGIGPQQGFGSWKFGTWNSGIGYGQGNMDNWRKP